MKTILLALLTCTTLEGATTLMRIETTISFLSTVNNPLSLNQPVIIELVYDSAQAEDFEEPTNDPNLQAANLASSKYTITNGSASIFIGSYSWHTTNYEITLRNDAPFLVQQDSLYVSFMTPAPASFAGLGFMEPTDAFILFLQDFALDENEPMNFLSSSTLPGSGNTLNLALIDQAEGTINGQTIPINWSASMNSINAISISSIPEPSTTILLLFALLIPHRKRNL